MDTPSHRQFKTNERESSRQLHPEIDRNSSFQGPGPKDVRLDRWNLKFDGSGRGLTVERFLFRVDRLQELYDLSHQQAFREFHLLLAGEATKWYWQLMEDKAEDYDFDYYSLTQEMERAFYTTGSDLMKVKELMERKQGQHETFSDYVSDMHNLHFKLKHKIDEDEFVELLKDNMNSRIPINFVSGVQKGGSPSGPLVKKTREKHAQHYKAFLIVQMFLHLINI